MTDSDELLDMETLTRKLKVSRTTVYEWRSRGGGPVAIKVGRSLRWRSSDVEQWLNDRTGPPKSR